MLTRVLLLLGEVPTYRLDALLAMQQDPRVQIEVAAASTAREPAIAVADTSALRHFTPLTNIGVGPLWWQRGALRLALKKDVDSVILLGDVRIISNWLVALLLRIRGKRVCYWTIGWHRVDSRAKRLIKRAFFFLADHLLLYGRTGLELGLDAGFPESRMTVIGNSAGRLPALYAQESTRDTIVAVGRLTRIKRLDLLLHAIHRLPERCRLDLVGDGPERTDLERLAADLNLDVIFHGAVYDDAELRKIYQRARATVIPGAVGLTAIQSMAYGVPVITHDDALRQMPEHEAIRHLETGYRYAYGSVDAMAHWINEALTLPLAEWKRLSDAARKEVEEWWTPLKQAQRIVDVLCDGAP